MTRPGPPFRRLVHVTLGIVSQLVVVFVDESVTVVGPLIVIAEAFGSAPGFDRVMDTPSFAGDAADAIVKANEKRRTVPGHEGRWASDVTLLGEETT